MEEEEKKGDPTERKHGLTSWLKARFFGVNRDVRRLDDAFVAELSGVRRVGRYEIVDKLGQGSMGMVYLGKDPYIQRDVAIKISSPSPDLEGYKAERYRERFFIEAQSAGRLMQPNIVAIYDAGLFGEFCYIAMEYVDGPTLVKYCRKENLLPVSKIVENTFAACRALDYAHKRGVIHRDIKPSNIMLDRAGAIKIADFGIACIETDVPFQRGIVGSPSYMSPEQVKEEPIEDKSDIFSLGCVMYELLTGERAFPGDNYFSILYKITHEYPAPPSSIRRELPEIFDKIIHKALSKDPGERYQTCMDFAYDLRVALRGLKGTIKKSKVEDVVDYVHHVPFFEHFTRDQVKEILMTSNLVKIRKGKVVVSEGDIDDAFFIILSGRAAVKKNGRFIAEITRGECFGEMSYLGGQTRAATVVAASDCIMMRISATLLDRSSKTIQLQFMKQFALTLLTRLDRSNQKES
ncbi:MAG: serine/threonine-protein kinase [Desulfatiglandaceae bacterium]|jgi:serine/threonine-protein kinase